MEEKVKQWKKDDSFAKIFFRPKSKADAVDLPPEDGDEVNDEDGDSDDWSDVKVVDNNSSDISLFFVYQTEWQRRLSGDMEMNWNYWMLHSARHKMRFHCFSLWSRQTSIIMSLRHLSAKESRQKILLRQ